MKIRVATTQTSGIDTIAAEMNDTEKQAYHSRSPDAVLEELDTNRTKGLSTEEAARRLVADGPNRLLTSAGTPWWKMLLGQFRSIVVWLLAFAALVASLTGNPLEAAAIVVVLVINALIGFAIEWQAGRALDALRKSSRMRARVTRDGTERAVDSEGLVRGDIVTVSAGDKVPADGRIIESFNLRSDESTLTGESLPVDKSAETACEGSPLAERSSMVYLGTTVTAGHGRIVITATGEATELGRVGTLLSSVPDERTPLEMRLARLGERLVYIVLAIAAAVFVTGYLRGDGIWMMLEVSISLAVAAVPEGLPAVTTLILAIGVLKMARRNAIVRRLAAVESLGSTTVICTDKTGTLTENKIAVRELLAADGTRYEPGKGGIPEGVVLRMLRAGVLCNEAVQDDEGGALGDPTETALISAAVSAGTEPDGFRSGAELLDERPFDPVEKRMTSIWKFRDGNVLAALKGGPSVVLSACDSFAGKGGRAIQLTEETKEEFLRANRELAGRAFRVLALAEKEFVSGAGMDIDAGFTFLGFAAMSDPLRKEAAASISSARNAGIRIVMLTGDQVRTADAIARELGLSNGERGSAVHASELAAGDAGLADQVKEATVFARVSPEDKFRIVRAFQDRGEVVAVTGDGINDAPALKQANIGVAMGMRGTDVAKEASDIVLTDDNFATIVKAVEGGRTIYANILRFVHMMFSHNLGEVLMIFAAILAGLPLPLLPLQILWINLVTDVFPALALAVEPPSEKTMSRPPRPKGSRMLSKQFLLLIGWQGAMLAAVALAAYVWALGEYGEGPQSRTVALLSLIGVQLGHFFNCRSRVRSVISKPFSNPWIFAAAGAVILLQAAAVLWPPLASVLGLTVPDSSALAVIALTVTVPVIVVEAVKAVIRRGLASPL